MSQPIRAEQLICAAVLPAFSPTGQRGYQTVYASPGLTKEDYRAMERRMDAPPEMTAGTVRWQYFRLPDDRAVVSSTRFFPPEGDICDSRGGSFLAHALVMADADFACAGYHPFDLADGFSFAASAREMVERFGKASGRAPVVEITPRANTPSGEGWPGTVLLALASIAASAETAAHDRRSLLIRGDPAQVEACLRMVFQLAPPAWRQHCSFDTWVTPAATRAGDWWAAGTNSPRTMPAGFLCLEAGTRTTSAPMHFPANGSESIYVRWLTAMLSGNEDNLSAAVGLAAPVQELARALDLGEKLIMGPPLDPNACASLEMVASTELSARLMRSTKEWLPAEAAGALDSWLVEHLPLQDRFGLALGDGDGIVGPLFSWLLESEVSLSNAAAARLQEMAVQQGHPGLALLVLSLQHKPDRAALAGALAEADATTFETVLRLAPKRVHPERLADAKHSLILLDWLSTADLRDEEWCATLAALVKSGCAGPFTPLTARAERLGRSSLRRLLHLSGEPWHADPAFEEMLTRRLKAKAENRPFWRRLF